MSWFNKTDEEIIERLRNSLSVDNFQFIGRYEAVSPKKFGFLKDVKSISGVRKFYPTNEGEPDDEKTRPLEIYTKSILRIDENITTNLQEGRWYKFYAIPAIKKLREDKNN